MWMLCWVLGWTMGCAHGPSGGDGTPVTVPDATATTPVTPEDGALAETLQPSLESGGGEGLSAVALSLVPCTDEEGDGFSVQDAQLEDGQLEVVVQYGGGCQTHTFVACWTGVVTAATPSQTAITIIHDGNDDNCRALMRSKLSIDLAPLNEVQVDQVAVHGTVVPWVGTEPAP